MKEKISLLLAGLIAGVLIGSLMPAQAHHASDLRAVKRQLAELRTRTQHLTRDGFYLGSVTGYQVLSLCQEGAAATWSQVTEAGGEDYRWLEACAPDTTADRAFKKQLRQYLKR